MSEEASVSAGVDLEQLNAFLSLDLRVFLLCRPPAQPIHHNKDAKHPRRCIASVASPFLLSPTLSQHASLPIHVHSACTCTRTGTFLCLRLLVSHHGRWRASSARSCRQ